MHRGSVHLAWRSCCVLHPFSKVIVMSNILQILAVSPAKTGTSKGGKAYSIVETHCAVLNEDGSAQGVGVWVLPREVPQDTKPGYYAPVYGMRAVTYGELRGQILGEIVGLVPLAPAAIKRIQNPPAAAPVAPSA
jgi:hypothetical protein